METVLERKRSKFARRLTDQQKVEIVIQKELRPTAVSTNFGIAQAFDVSEGLVDHSNYDALNPEQKLLYEQRKKQIRYDALELTANAIKKSNELVNMATSPSHLSSVVAAMGKGYEIGRLEDNLPTTMGDKTLENVIHGLLQVLANDRVYYAKHINAEPRPENFYIETAAKLCNALKVDVEPAEMLAKAQAKLAESE